MTTKTTKKTRTQISESKTQPLLRIRDVALHLQVTERTVRNWIAAGDLIAHRFGRLVRITPGELERFIKLHRAG